MGPAILLCPSSSAAQLWGQALPSIKTKQKEGSISLSQRCAACPGDLTTRPTFFLHFASPSEKCRKYFTWRRVSVAAAAASEVSVEEAVAVSDAEQSVPSTTISEGSPLPAVDKPQARRTLNRSNSSAKKAVTVSPAELVPGALFPGKVVAIQAFGAFVDFGAFTNGLVHISRLSKSFVKKVEDVVQIGLDVKVEVLEVDFEANRISLKLFEEAKEDTQLEEGDKDAQRGSQQQARAPRRDTVKRPPAQKKAVTTTLKKGEVITGTVKNMIKSGVFLSLPDGTDGYLPIGEVIFKAPNTSLEAHFQVGEEVTVRVLRVDRGRVNLTMKREVNFDKLNEDLNKGSIGMATNPFELAFRRNEVIAGYLSERDKQKAQAEAKDEVKEEAAAAVASEDVTEEQRVESSDVNEEPEASVEEVKDVVEEQGIESSKGEEEAAPVEEVKDVVEEQGIESLKGKKEEYVEEVNDVVEDQGIESLKGKEEEEDVEEVKDVVEEQGIESSKGKEEEEEAADVKDVVVAEEQRIESSDSKEGASIEEVKDVKSVEPSNAKEDEAAEEQQGDAK